MPARRFGFFVIATLASFLILSTVFKMYCLVMGHNFMETIFGTYCGYVLAIWAGAELTLSFFHVWLPTGSGHPRTRLTQLFGLS